MKHPHLINAAVLRMLGCTEEHILSADIELRPSCFPVVTLSRLLLELPPINGELQEQIERFELVAKDASPQRPPFDLDAMCAAAQARVAQAISDAASKHSQEVRDEFIWLKATAGRGIWLDQDLEAVKKAWAALSRLCEGVA
jgi:hypothetical protein